MASYSVGQVVEYRTTEGSWMDAVVLVDNTGDNVDLIARYPNGPFYLQHAAIDLGVSYNEFRTK